MKKLIIFVIIVGGLVGGYYWLSKNARMSIGALQGQTVVTTRGDLIVPITASGNIKPASVTQIKSKASGEVIAIPVEIGQTVKVGDLLIQLKDDDERRARNRAESDYVSAEIMHTNAQTTLEQLKTTGRAMARAKLENAQAQAYQVTAQWKHLAAQTRPSDPEGGGAFPKIEQDTKWGLYMAAQAAVNMAQAELDDIDYRIRLGEQEVRKAAEVVKSARAALDDADERLRETQIRSPLDGLVLTKKVQVGEVVQSGKTMFTGGTVLMEIADVREMYAVVNVDEADIGLVRNLAPAELGNPTPTTRPARIDPAAAGTRPSDAPEGERVQLPPGVIEEGQPVAVEVEAFPDEQFTGLITRIAPQSEIQAAVATFQVWIRITSPNVYKLTVLQNAQAEARFTARAVRNALLVSYDAAQRNPNGEDYGVYVPVPQPGTLRPKPTFKPCKFGADDGIMIEVKSGLNEGDVVYTKLPQKTRQEEEAEEKDNG